MKHFNFSKTLSLQPAAADTKSDAKSGGQALALHTPLPTPTQGSGPKSSSDLKEDWYKIQAGLNKFQSELKKPGSTELLFRNKSRRMAGRSKRGARRGKTSPSLPPPLSTTPTFDHTYRYQVKTTGTYAITCQELALAFGSVCTITNSHAVSIISSFRVKKVTIWPSCGPYTAAPDDSDIFWYSPVSTMSKDTAKSRELPAGVTVTGPLVSRPPRGSLAGAWIQSNTATSVALFGIIAGEGAIIDVHAVCTLANNLGASTSAATIATGTIGNIYYLSLDAGSNNLPAVGITTTI